MSTSSSSILTTSEASRPTPSHPFPQGKGNGSGSSGSTNIFATSGGPPLILVFLAAGLLTGALVALLILRRLYPQGVRGSGRLPLVRTDSRRGGNGKSSRRIGEKPILWDMYGYDGIDDDAYEDEYEDGEIEKVKRLGQWDNLSPISARFIPSSDPPRPVSPTSQPSHLSFIQKYKFISRNRKASRGAPKTLNSDDPNTTGPIDLQTIDGQLEIAVAIAMPRAPPLPISSTRSGEPGLDYCLGLTQIPWRDPLMTNCSEKRGHELER